MKAVIERVSRYGIMIDGRWLNLSKFHKGVSLDGFGAGDEVEIELQKDKFITLLEHANGESNGNGSSTTKSSGSNNPSPRATNTGTNGAARQDTITRLSVISSVFGSQWLGSYFRDMDYSQAVSEALTLVNRLTELAEGKNQDANTSSTPVGVA